LKRDLPHIMINVKILSRKEIHVFESASPYEIYEKLGLYPTEWLAIYNGKIIPDDRVVESGEIILVPVVSGG